MANLLKEIQDNLPTDDVFQAIVRGTAERVDEKNIYLLKAGLQEAALSPEDLKQTIEPYDRRITDKYKEQVEYIVEAYNRTNIEKNALQEAAMQAERDSIQLEIANANDRAREEVGRANEQAQAVVSRTREEAAAELARIRSEIDADSLEKIAQAKREYETQKASAAAQAADSLSVLKQEIELTKANIARLTTEKADIQKRLDACLRIDNLSPTQFDVVNVGIRKSGQPNLSGFKPPPVHPLPVSGSASAPVSAAPVSPPAFAPPSPASAPAFSPPDPAFSPPAPASGAAGPAAPAPPLGNPRKGPTPLVNEGDEEGDEDDANRGGATYSKKSNRRNKKRKTRKYKK